MKNISLPVVGPVSPVVLLVAGGAVILALMNARALVRAAAGVAVDAGVGAVEGIGQAVGIPVTNQTECQKDLASGNTWAASFSCPASTWLKSLWD